VGNGALSHAGIDAAFAGRSMIIRLDGASEICSRTAHRYQGYELDGHIFNYASTVMPRASAFYPLGAFNKLPVYRH
jgi:hypothetical protein